MSWDISFLSEDDFKEHVRKTILQYGKKLQPYTLKEFNSNLIDPVKMVFDKAVYGKTWEEIISAEIYRQRDKASTNDIGYFHQRMFAYIDRCTVPPNGTLGGWDVIVDMPDGYEVSAGNTVHKIYVELKNKHNTMNSASAGKTYIKMQNQLLQDDDCACFLVEVIAKQRQDIPWATTVDGRKVSHRNIRRVSIDSFYYIVTGKEDAFFRICMALPKTVEEVLADKTIASVPKDTVIEEMLRTAEELGIKDKDRAMLMAMYMLGFGSYFGFSHE